MNLDHASRLGTLPVAFPATMAALHRVAELLVAPARKPDNEIALQATPGGFGTPVFPYDGADHQVRVDGAELVHAAGGEERRAPLTSLDVARGAVADLVPGALGDAPLGVDPESAARLADWYAFGAAVLRELGREPILWPEHFDIGITTGGVSYGVSPGDRHVPEPYAYVSTSPAPVGPFWNVSFGSARPMRELHDAEAVRAYFAEGARLAAGDLA